MSYLQALAVFIAVAEEKIFSAAARKLSLTQPTVSFHIDGMERNFAVTRWCCNVALQVSGNEALKRAVLAGAGIGFVSRRVVESEVNVGTLAILQIEGLSIIRRFYALRHGNQEFPAAEALWEYLVTMAEAEMAVRADTANN